MTEKLKRKCDWNGRYVRLRHRAENNGGGIFPEGTVMRVERNKAGLHLERPQNCAECGNGYRSRLTLHSEREVDLLPVTYRPRPGDGYNPPAVGERVPLTQTRPGDLIAVPTESDSADGVGLYRVLVPGDEEGTSGTGLRLDVQDVAPYSVNFQHPFAQTVLVVGRVCYCEAGRC